MVVLEEHDWTDTERCPCCSYTSLPLLLCCHSYTFFSFPLLHAHIQCLGTTRVFMILKNILSNIVVFFCMRPSTARVIRMKKQLKQLTVRRKMGLWKWRRRLSYKSRMIFWKNLKRIFFFLKKCRSAEHIKESLRICILNRLKTRNV